MTYLLVSFYILEELNDNKDVTSAQWKGSRPDVSHSPNVQRNSNAHCENPLRYKVAGVPLLSSQMVPSKKTTL